MAASATKASTPKKQSGKKRAASSGKSTPATKKGRGRPAGSKNKKQKVEEVDDDDEEEENEDMIIEIDEQSWTRVIHPGVPSGMNTYHVLSNITIRLERSWVGYQIRMLIRRVIQDLLVVMVIQHVYFMPYFVTFVKTLRSGN